MISDFLPRCEECELRHATLCGTFFEAAPKEYAGLQRTYIHIGARRTICRAGAVARLLYTVRDGWAFSFRVLTNGRRQIFDIFVPGDVIGIQTSVQRMVPNSVVALTDVELCVFDASQIVARGIGFPAFANDYAKRCKEYMCALEDRVVKLGRHTATSRIASLTLYLYNKLSVHGLIKETAFEFPLRQSHIADALGLTTAHVNRMLGELRAEKILSLEQGTLAILDVERLSELAGSADA